MSPALAAAQTVFFDDFQGNDLLPHWGTPLPQDWEYNVSRGMLNVTGLFYPSHPKHPSNFAGISAQYAAQAEFRLDVWMGWEAGDTPHRLGIHIHGPGGGPVIASIVYRNEGWHGATPEILLGTGTQGVAVPAPPPGIHHFAITRDTDQFRFFVGGSMVATLPDISGLPAAGLGFEFLGPYPGQFGTLHVAHVSIVPAPGPFGLLLVLSTVGACRRRPA